MTSYKTKFPLSVGHGARYRFFINFAGNSALCPLNTHVLASLDGDWINYDGIINLNLPRARFLWL